MQTMECFVEPCGATLWKPPRTIPQAEQNLVEPWDSHGPGHPQPLQTLWNPAGTLVEPSWNHALAEPGAKWNPCGTTPDNPAALAEPGRLVKPSWNLTSNHPPRPCRTWWNFGGTLVEPSWNLAAPDHLWAETQSFQLLREKWAHFQK